MPHLWPEDTDFALWELDVLDRDCPACGRMMYICDHRHRHFFTLDGPVELVCKLNHCPDPRCPGHAKTKSPEIEPTIALPGWGIAWDVFCWIGHRRFSRHWSIPQIRGELHDAFAIDLTEPGIANYIRRYQAMLAARQQDPEALRRHYHGDRGAHPLDRRPATREGARDALRRPRADRQAGLVRRGVALRHGRRSPTADRPGEAMGRRPGQAGGPLDLGQAGRLRDRDRGGIPGGAAPLLRQPFPPRPGQAGPRGRQSCQGSDASRRSAA